MRDFAPRPKLKLEDDTELELWGDSVEIEAYDEKGYICSYVYLSKGDLEYLLMAMEVLPYHYKLFLEDMSEEEYAEIIASELTNSVKQIYGLFRKSSVLSWDKSKLNDEYFYGWKDNLNFYPKLNSIVTTNFFSRTYLKVINIQYVNYGVAAKGVLYTFKPMDFWRKMKDLALYIFMRSDLNMSRGKIAVQAGHAVATIMARENQTTIQEWMQNDQIKIVLIINSEEDIIGLEKECIKRNLKYVIIQDAGKTEINPGTATCIGVGIEPRNRLFSLAKGYKSLK